MARELDQLTIPLELKVDLKKKACLENAIALLSLTKDKGKPLPLTPLKYVYESYNKKFLVTYDEERTIIYKLTDAEPKFFEQVEVGFINIHLISSFLWSKKLANWDL